MLPGSPLAIRCECSDAGCDCGRMLSVFDRILPLLTCVVAAYSGVFSAGFGVFRARYALLTPERAGAALAGDRDLARLCCGDRAVADEPPLMLPTRTAGRNSSWPPAMLMQHFALLDVHRRCAVAVVVAATATRQSIGAHHSPAGPPLVVASLDPHSDIAHPDPQFCCNGIATLDPSRSYALLDPQLAPAVFLSRYPVSRSPGPPVRRHRPLPI